MNAVEKLLKLDANQVKNPTGVHKMFCRKVGMELEFEIEAVDPERAFEIKMEALKVNNSKKGAINTDIDAFRLKTRTILAGCKLFADKNLMAHYNAPTPLELLKKLLTEGEINSLADAITALGEEVTEDEIKN